MAKYRVTLGNPAFLPDMEEAAIQALRNDRYVGGENVAKFEEEFARFVGTKFAVSTASGTAALAFALEALGAKGQRYVTTPMSFIATANAVLHAGGVPVFGDISDSDYCLDPSTAEGQLKKGVKGILPVDLYGQPADYDGFRGLAETYKVPIIEDACQAHGAKYGGRAAGNLGSAAAFSFYPSKNMTVLGDGGMLTTNDEDVASLVAKLRDCGRVSHYEHDLLGYTSRLNTVSAAIGRVQLKHLVAWNERRRRIAASYWRGLKEFPSLKLPPMPDGKSEPVFHQYVIRLKDRDGLKNFLEGRGIQCGIHYPIPIHLQPLYIRLYGFAGGAFPRSETHAVECLSLPMHPFIKADDARYVVETVVQFLESEAAA